MSKSDQRVATFLCDIQWKTLPQEVQDRVVGCAIDLFGAVIAGTAAPVAGIGRNIAKRHFPGGEASILMTPERASLPGAALANGLAANALDIDDGHRLIKGHPGAVIFPAVLAAAEQREIGLQAFLTALVAAYETAIRAGLAMQRHYDYYHSTGAWGAVGAAAGASKIFGLTKEETVCALATADFHAPMVPVMRSVAFPSHCKDGAGWGAMAGLLAALLAGEGFTGGPHGRTKHLRLPRRGGSDGRSGEPLRNHESLLQAPYLLPLGPCRHPGRPGPAADAWIFSPGYPAGPHPDLPGLGQPLPGKAPGYGGGPV